MPEAAQKARAQMRADVRIGELRVAYASVHDDISGVPIVDAHVHLYPSDLNRDPIAGATHSGTHGRSCARRRKDGRGVQTLPLDRRVAPRDGCGRHRARRASGLVLAMAGDVRMAEPVLRGLCACAPGPAEWVCHFQSRSRARCHARRDPPGARRRAHRPR